MKSISEYLVHIRTAAIKSDIKITGWRLYTASLILFLVGLMFENVFYLSPFIRYTSLMVMGSLLLVIGLCVLVIIYQITQNKYGPYRLSNLAKKTGRYAFPKEDTLINALQIERSGSLTTSASLGNAFIQQTVKKLENFMNKTAIYPGTFDPITNGHIDVIKRSLKIVDKLIIAVSNDHSKEYLFSSEERSLIVEKSLFNDLKLSKKKNKNSYI